GGNSFGANFVPAQLGTDTDWLVVQAGGAGVFGVHFYAGTGIKTDGSLFGWGYNINGEAGLGHNNPLKDPMQVGSAKNWRQLSDVLTHVCAITDAGALYCWGSGAWGQLGIKPKADQLSPSLVQDPGPWREVAIHTQGTCGIKTDGTLYCWGSPYGTDVPKQEGTDADWRTLSGLCAIKTNGTLHCRTVTFGPRVQVGTHTDWHSATSGAHHECALRSTGDLYCWGGFNLRGELGGATFASSSSVPGKPVFHRRNWVAIDGGSSEHACGIDSAGALLCWGNSYGGALGNGQTGGSTTPYLIADAGPWESVDSGQAGGCAIKAVGGSLHCWGINSSGQAGDGSKTAAPTPVDVSQGKKWRGVSMGFSHACGVTTDNTLRCWGGNADGQLGDGTKNDQPIPTQSGTGTDWLDVSTGSGHTCAVKTSGALYCWGLNANGQLG
ncbi:MAG: hypothetical protein Q8N51_00380, partial [Gammaproteobacteria bacterium]|nr:hypothetical protein [Gammaproteobacteria bacterium]